MNYLLNNMELFSFIYNIYLKVKTFWKKIYNKSLLDMNHVSDIIFLLQMHKWQTSFDTKQPYCSPVNKSIYSCTSMNILTAVSLDNILKSLRLLFLTLKTFVHANPPIFYTRFTQNFADWFITIWCGRSWARVPIRSNQRLYNWYWLLLR
jgi:hypothetical protein